MLRRFFLIIGTLVFSINCSAFGIFFNDDHKTLTRTNDVFYSPYYKGDPNLPLIKPYHAEYFGGSEEWFIGFHSSPGPGFSGAGPVVDIDVKNNIIFAYATGGGGVVLHGERISQAWYVIRLDKQIETGFDSLNEFELYVSEKNLETPKWKDIQQIWDAYNQTGYLPWEDQQDFLTW